MKKSQGSNAINKLFLVYCYVILITVKSIFSQEVLTGIDVIEANNFVTLDNQKIGLITNHTGVNKNWKSTIDILHEASQVQLIAIFTPEHGLRGKSTGKIASEVDQSTGVPIYSLYGDVKRPTTTMLKNIQTLVFDIQDIGSRYYTYIGTMKNCMIAASNNNINFIVLDRPNPINGIDIEGPVLKQKKTFELAGIHSLPIRHGMTIGELALMFNKEDKLGLELEVIKMKGWKRSMWFDETNLPWINPSPNIRSLSQAILYSGIGLLERLNVNNKRGLDRPFEMFGAPWINSVELANHLNNRDIGGVKFMPIQFISPQGIYANKKCEGVAINLINRDSLETVSCSIKIIKTVTKLYPDSLEINKLWHLLRSEEVRNSIKNKLPASKIIKNWSSELNEFKNRRKQYLLY